MDPQHQPTRADPLHDITKKAVGRITVVAAFVILPLACVTWILFSPQLSIGLCGIMAVWAVCMILAFYFLGTATGWFQTFAAGLGLVLTSLVVLTALHSRRDAASEGKRDERKDLAITMLSNSVLLLSAAVGGNAIFSALDSSRRE